jgi:hypothetical protein
MTVGIGPKRTITLSDYRPGLTQTGGPAQMDGLRVSTLPSSLRGRRLSRPGDAPHPLPTENRPHRARILRPYRRRHPIFNDSRLKEVIAPGRHEQQRRRYARSLMAARGDPESGPKGRSAAVLSLGSTRRPSRGRRRRAARQEYGLAGRAQRPIGLKEESWVAGQGALTTATMALRKWRGYRVVRSDRRVRVGAHGRSPTWATRWLRWTSLRSWRMRTDPKASTSKAPRATATRSATPSGSVPDRDTKLTFDLRRFCKTNNKMAANRTRTGSTRVHVLLARVEGIAPGTVAAETVLSALASLRVKASNTATGSVTSSAAPELNSRAPIGTPNLSRCGRGAIARIELTLRLSHFLVNLCDGGRCNGVLRGPAI